MNKHNYSQLIELHIEAYLRKHTFPSNNKNKSSS